MTDESKGNYMQQINIWSIDEDGNPGEIAETIELTLEDASYGDVGEAMYFTGKTDEGKFVEVIVLVPERLPGRTVIA